MMIETYSNILSVINKNWTHTKVSYNVTVNIKFCGLFNKSHIRSKIDSIMHHWIVLYASDNDDVTTCLDELQQTVMEVISRVLKRYVKIKQIDIKF